uniref:Uncharacterized protein n=1 Tax=Globodera rostochiensis TaxID=31243 RepID=A0A914H355_GLORO
MLLPVVSNFNCVKNLERLLLLIGAILLLSVSTSHCVQQQQQQHVLHKRQTFHYPEELKEYAQNYHTGTRVIHGTLGRFAPQDWPAWYTRTMMKWNGESRMSPYSPNDVQYRAWRINRILSEQP